MNCNEICDKLSLYIDNELSNEEMLQMEEHINSCENCKKELEEYNNIISILQSLPEEEPPEGYCKRLHNKLIEVNDTMEKEKTPKIKRFNNRWLKYAGVAAAFVLVFLVYSINNLGMRTKNEASYDMAQSESYPASPAEAPQSAGYGAYPEEESKQGMDIRGEALSDTSNNSAMISMAATEREMKIIKAGTISVQTENYELFIDDLSMKLNSLGGFLESNNTEVYSMYQDKKLMYGSIKIRVPQESFYEMVDYLESNAEVRRKNINETDVTKEYYEKDNKVKNLEVQEQHLRDLFEKANTVEEMLQIENELRRIRTEIDALNISLSDINDRASMSTINLEVEEVLSATFAIKSKDNVWERSKEGFINTVNSIIRSIENLIVNIISSSPILIPFIIICIVGFFKIKKYWKRKI